MRQRLVPPHRDQEGFTLVEVMVAAMVLMVGVLGTFVMIDGANRTTRENNARTAASAIAREILEHARTVEYTKVAPATLIRELRTKPEIEGTIDAAGNWVLRQRNMKVTVSASVCTYDDPSDGRSDPAQPVVANACPAGAGTTTLVDSNPDDFRRVTLTLRWSEGGRTRQIVQTSQLNNPSGGLGPRILTYLDPNGGNQILAAAGDQIEFNATSTFSNNVSWASDDGRVAGRGEIAGPAESWRWFWKLGAVGTGTPRGDWVVDGTYTINVQPFDSRGVPGEMRVANVWLNRRVPLAPRGFLGGRSNPPGVTHQVVEMDWAANVERDIIGYRVYRHADSLRTRICPPASSPEVASKQLSCVDENPPGGAIRYELRAVDREDIKNPLSLPREGGALDASWIDVGSSLGTRLAEPTNLRATTSAAQKPQLDWTAPSPIPTGEGVHFYRVYRDGRRYGRTTGPAPQYSDPSPESTSHTYQVSAVHDPSYREGHLSAPVVWEASGG